MARHIKKGEMVEIIAGDHKGATGRVMRVMPDKQRVLVEGLNLAYKHVRPSQRNPQGGRIRVERPIHISNVQPVSGKGSKGTRVRFQTDSKGVKKKVAVDGSEIAVVRKTKKG
ncbi:MAG TPA: 50S ribosomal protein L24 [Anaerohalosphaeraceae bacterium]|jgi:large subunit ribosomal protein L24|nr:50S ribosomal protein L24 [Anaerohalosphaeraceae bacterium]HRT49229.1 50S ribosomal protein L24 [Anaerohalosphaeraceae bacterium]HRT85232.1 50S ribosomal protein L24 [Anaerohalosphaeraceae bacterium]